MIRYLIVAAATCLAGCVTPLSAADQAPAVQYAAPGRTLVAVIDERIRTEQGRPENFAGFARNYGIPNHWTVETLMRGAREDQHKTMAQLLRARIIAGMAAGGSSVANAALGAALSDDEAAALLAREGADRLLTIVLQDWHFDLNINWVGRIQFNSDAAVTVQTPAGAILREQFAERAAIQAQGDESWPNMILAAYRAKLEEILHDPDVRAALVAPPPPLAAPDVLEAEAPDDAMF